MQAGTLVSGGDERLVVRGLTGRAVLLAIVVPILASATAFLLHRGLQTQLSYTALYVALSSPATLFCAVMAAWAPALEITSEGVTQRLRFRTASLLWSDVTPFRVCKVRKTESYRVRSMRSSYYNGGDEFEEREYTVDQVGFDYKVRPSDPDAFASHAVRGGKRSHTLEAGWVISAEELAELLNQERNRWVPPET